MNLEKFKEKFSITILGMIAGLLIGFILFENSFMLINKDPVIFNDKNTKLYLSKEENQYISFTENLKDKNYIGGVFRHNPNNILIQNDLPPTTLYKVCVHERLHSKGIESEFHPYINNIQDQIIDPYCIKFIYHLKPKK